MYLGNSKLFGFIKTCNICDKKYIKDTSNNYGICSSCYENKEIMLCRTCGKEISKREFDEHLGLCHICDFESDIGFCIECGKEFKRSESYDVFLCVRCWEEEHKDLINENK